MKTEKKNNYTNDARDYYLKYINNIHKQRKNNESLKTYRN